MRHPPAHRMAHDDRVFRLEMLHQGHDILGKHRRGVIHGRFARLSGAAIVVNDYAMVAGELFDLMDLPNLAVAGRFAEKDHRPPFTALFVVDFYLVYSYFWHARSLPSLCCQLPRIEYSMRRSVASSGKLRTGTLLLTEVVCGVMETGNAQGRTAHCVTCLTPGGCFT